MGPSQESGGDIIRHSRIMCRPQRSGNKADEIKETEDEEILPRLPSNVYKESRNTEPAGKRALSGKRANKMINPAINNHGHARESRGHEPENGIGRRGRGTRAQHNKASERQQRRPYNGEQSRDSRGAEITS